MSQQPIHLINANADPFTHFVEDLILRNVFRGAAPTFEQVTLMWEETDLDDKAVYFERAREFCMRQQQPVVWPQPENISNNKRRDR